MSKNVYYLGHCLSYIKVSAPPWCKCIVYIPKHMLKFIFYLCPLLIVVVWCFHTVDVLIVDVGVN